jgi:hypothetical protein
MGATRKAALLKLLGHVEGRIGEMMVQDRREMREKEGEREGGRMSGGNWWVVMREMNRFGEQVRWVEGIGLMCCFVANVIV